MRRVRARQRLAVLSNGHPMTDYLPPTQCSDQTPLRYQAAMASTLVAGLMLAQDGKLTLEQDNTWRPIRVRRGDLCVAVAATTSTS